MVDRLTSRLGEVWNVPARDGHGEVYLPKFAPRSWVEDGRLDRGRLVILHSAGWEIREVGGKRYLMPDEELARYALGWAYEDYVRVIGGGARAQPPSPLVGEGRVRGGEYGDLVDAILYSDTMAKEERLSSGARLIYPEQFSSVGSGSVERRVELALRGGWVMVGLITDPGDLFLLPPKSIGRGNKVTPEDATIGRGVLQELRKRGLISLRGKGFGGGGIAPVSSFLPLRTAHGGEWKKMIEEQQSRWGGSEIRPVVDLANVGWLERFSTLKQWLENYHSYVESFDLMRIKFFVDAWSGTSDIEALDRMVGGIKGVLGEIAARPGIVEEYRKFAPSPSPLPRGERVRERVVPVLVFAPQILSGEDVLERSDAVIVSIDGTGGVTIKRVWEIVTDESGKAHAAEQNAASLEAYQGKGIIFRRADGRSRTFTNVAVAGGDIGSIVTAKNGNMESALSETREALVTEMGIDLIMERMRGKFFPTFEELKVMMREEGGVERLMEILAGSPSEGRLVLVGQPQGDKVSGLRLVSEGEAKEFSRSYFQFPSEWVEGRYQLDSKSARKGRKLLGLIFPKEKPSGPKLSSLGAGTLDDAYWGAHDWWQESRGERLPATKENLARHGLLEPATVRGRAIRYLPGEGVAGLVAVFAAPVVTERLFQINLHRNPEGFHAANFGALHFLNATGGAVADIIPQMGRGVSAVRVGREVVTSSSLGRTFLRSAGQRLIHVGGLAEGAIWAYPGYVAGDGLTGFVTDNPTARAIGGGIGAIGIPTGLKIWLGEQGMSRLAATAVGRAAGPVGAVLLAKDIGEGAYETMVRQDLEDAEIALRERVIHELPWCHRQFCEWSDALFMSGIGTFLGAPGVVACEPAIAEKMDAIDGSSRRLRFHASPADLQKIRIRLSFPLPPPKFE